MARLIGALMPLLILSGCQSALIDQRSAGWPSNDKLVRYGVVAVETTGAVADTPFIAPIGDGRDNRFVNEADAELVGVSESNWPMLRPAPGKKLLVFHLKREVPNQLLSDRWTEVFSFDAEVMNDLRRGRISVDQVGWSIYQVQTDVQRGRSVGPNVYEIQLNETWSRLDREALRRRTWVTRLLE